MLSTLSKGVEGQTEKRGRIDEEVGHEAEVGPGV